MIVYDCCRSDNTRKNALSHPYYADHHNQPSNTTPTPHPIPLHPIPPDPTSPSYLDERPVIGHAALERFAVFAVGDVVDAYVSVLAGSEDVPLTMVHLHVVEGRLTHHVMAERELQLPLGVLRGRGSEIMEVKGHRGQRSLRSEVRGHQG